MKHIFILLLSIFMLTACRRHAAPEGILEEKQMVEVLTDLSVVDGYMATLLYSDTLRIQGKNYYATVYKNHNTSKAVFDKSMKYYSLQPVLLDSMYSKVSKRLEAKEKRLNKIYELEQRKKTLVK
ncbi:DUF4296 domain-containing protein [Daejeonella lutea]|uniref:DUF4296 domain-containing protein n=1 Tax=Daejeonella lutea TaxID=572036 RepID=A0A1T5AF63_9SPHI|nr:DUF4296 domain-containing protein [Daejeonella lutea]SKB33618.1 protein of unknown function [Daejeonella lutea]